MPGDIVGFEAGDKVPADGRLLVAATLEIEEAALTGESTPVLKVVDPVAGDDVALGDRIDMAYMNSTGHPRPRRDGRDGDRAWRPRSATSPACSAASSRRRRRSPSSSTS